MSDLIKPSMVADLEEEFLAFDIELQIQILLKFRKWYPAVQGMSKILTELLENKNYGLLNFEYWFAFRRQLFLMYWRSYEHMHDWVLNKTTSHIPGWKVLNQLMKDHPDIIGLWHESYVVHKYQYESFYHNVLTVGLGRAGKLVPIQGRVSTAAARSRETRSQTSSLAEYHL